MKFKQKVHPYFTYVVVIWGLLGLAGVLGITLGAISGLNTFLYSVGFGVISLLVIKLWDTELVEIQESQLYVHTKGKVDYNDGIDIMDITAMYLRPIIDEKTNKVQDILLQIEVREEIVFVLSYNSYGSKMWDMMRAMKELNEAIKHDTLLAQNKENFCRILQAILIGKLAPQSYLEHDLHAPEYEQELEFADE